PCWWPAKPGMVSGAGTIRPVAESTTPALPMPSAAGGTAASARTAASTSTSVSTTASGPDIAPVGTVRRACTRPAPSTRPALIFVPPRSAASTGAGWAAGTVWIIGVVRSSHQLDPEAGEHGPVTFHVLSFERGHRCAHRVGVDDTHELQRGLERTHPGGGTGLAHRGEDDLEQCR